MKIFFILFFGFQLVIYPETTMAADPGFVNRSTEFFKKLDGDHLQLVDEFYDQDVEFQDPVHKVHGAAGMKKYYGQLYQNVKSVHFEFSQTVAEGQSVVLVWKMFLQTDKLNGGKEFSVDGTSVITFGGPLRKAIKHRDYFDLGEFIYERIPVLRSVIEMIKGKLAD
jgi:hypothetical protein